jgi:prephenate dehydrogenase
VSTIVVLGGAGVVGRWAGAHLAAPADTTMTVDLVGEVDLLADVTEPTGPLAKILGDADAVVLALPEDVAAACLDWLPDTAAPEAIVLPTCSVQAPVFGRAARVRMSQQLVGVNPMFSPTLPSAGRPVALISTEHREPPDWVAARLTSAGMTVTGMTPEEHDATMSYLQALPHAAVLGFVAALATAPIDAERLMALAPPPARTLVALACRILTAPAEIYWDIQYANPAAHARRTELRQAIEDLDGAVAERRPEDFRAMLDDAARWLGPYLANGAEHCRTIFRSPRPDDGSPAEAGARMENR